MSIYLYVDIIHFGRIAPATNIIHYILHSIVNDSVTTTFMKTDIATVVALLAPAPPIIPTAKLKSTIKKIQIKLRESTS